MSERAVIACDGDARVAAVAPRVAPSPVALVFLRGRDADGRVRMLVGERRALRPLLGLLASRLLKRRGYESLGFRSLGDYARERLGVTGCVVREWGRVSEALAVLPRLRVAVVSGEVSWSVARRAVGHATPETDAAFVLALRGRTVRAAEEMLRATFGVGQEAVGEERVRVSVPLPASGRAQWGVAIELARRMAGERLPVWECAEAIAAEALAAISPEHVAAAGGEDAAPCVAGSRSGVTKPAMGRSSREHGLREEAFSLLRWDRLGLEGEAGVGRVAAWAETASPHALDRALRRAIRRLQRIDHDLGHLLRQVLERRLHRELGFTSFERYAEERVDVSPRTARRWVRLARLGPVGSAVANAFRSGELSAKQADLVSERVPPAQQGDAVDFARRVTLRRLEDAYGDLGAPRDTLVFSAPPDTANVFTLALAAVALHLGAQGRPDSTPADALLWMIDHAIAAWTEQGEQFHDYADFERDGFRCTAPGCTARRNLQSHHIVFRSHGGPDESWNRTTLCAFHHHRGIHARTMACTGRAPEGLVFALGLRSSGSALLRTRSGDVLLGVGNGAARSRAASA